MNFILENSQLQNFDQNSAHQLVLSCYNRQLEQHHSSQVGLAIELNDPFPTQKGFSG